MPYSNFYLKQKNFPHLVLLVLPVIIVISFGFFFGKLSITTKAVKKNIKDIEIVNFTSNQAGIFWKSNAKEISWIIYGESENNLDKTSFDERDIQDNKKAYINHYVILKNLQRSTDYYFKIVSNNQISTDINGNAFKIKTPAIFNAAGNTKLGYGKILSANGSPLEGAIVLLKKESEYPFITITKTTGEWLIPVSYFIEKGTDKITIPSVNDPITIEVFNENGDKTKIAASIQQISPLSQSIIIGRDYQFNDSNDVLAASVGNTSFTNVDRVEESFGIIYPKERSIIPGNSPLINGIGIPNNYVFINLNYSDFKTQTVKVNASGKWIIDKPIILPVGDYTLSVKTKDETNRDIFLKRNFSIAKSGETVMGLATESATPIVINNITSTPTLTPSPIGPVAGFNPTFLVISSSMLILLGFSLLLAF